VIEILLLLARLTLGTLGEHAGQPLNADLQLDIPDAQDLILGEADELAAGLDELDLHHRRHVATQDLGAQGEAYNMVHYTHWGAQGEAYSMVHYTLGGTGGGLQ